MKRTHIREGRTGQHGQQWVVGGVEGGDREGGGGGEGGVWGGEGGRGSGGGGRRGGGCGGEGTAHKRFGIPLYLYRD